MKRFFIVVLMVAQTLASTGTANAAARTLLQSDSLRIDGRLTPTRLYLTHTNLTDYPLDFRCRTQVEGVRYKTYGTLYPHEVWTTRFRTSADRLRGATTGCALTLHDDLTILYKGTKLEVLGEGLIQPGGEPQTNFFFYSITSESVTFTCTWDEGDPPTRQTWTETLSGYDMDSYTVYGLDFSQVSNFTCTES